MGDAGGTCGGGGARDDNVDWCGEFVGTAGEEFDAVVNVVHAVGNVQFFEGDGFGWIQTAFGDPVLYAVQVYWSEVHGKTNDSRSVRGLVIIWRSNIHILEAHLSMCDRFRRLSAIELLWNFSSCLLTFLTTAGGLTLPR